MLEGYVQPYEFACPPLMTRSLELTLMHYVS